MNWPVPPLSETLITASTFSGGLNMASDMTMGVMDGQKSHFFEAGLNLVSFGSGRLLGRWALNGALPGYEKSTELFWSNIGSFLPRTIYSGIKNNER